MGCISKHGGRCDCPRVMKQREVPIAGLPGYVGPDMSNNILSWLVDGLASARMKYC
jgi:hypothetical protein